MACRILYPRDGNIRLPLEMKKPVLKISADFSNSISMIVMIREWAYQSSFLDIVFNP